VYTGINNQGTDQRRRKTILGTRTRDQGPTCRYLGTYGALEPLGMSKREGEGQKAVMTVHTYARNSKKVFYDHQKSFFDVIGVIDVIYVCFQ
jgi:hypothetical protein